MARAFPGFGMLALRVSVVRLERIPIGSNRDALQIPGFCACPYRKTGSLLRTCANDHVWLASAARQDGMALNTGLPWLARATVENRSPRSPPLWQRRLHDEAAGAGIDHTEPAEREQRERLHAGARRGGIGGGGWRERADDTRAQPADEGCDPERDVPLRGVAAFACVAGQPLELRSEPPPVGRRPR